MAKGHKKMLGCCKVENVVSVDERGQMVLPKKLRDKIGIKAGDKLAVVTWGEGEDCSCICLFKAEQLNEMAKKMLGPFMKR